MKLTCLILAVFTKVNLAEYYIRLDDFVESSCDSVVNELLLGEMRKRFGVEAVKCEEACVQKAKEYAQGLFNTTWRDFKVEFWRWHKDDIIEKLYELILDLELRLMVKERRLTKVFGCYQDGDEVSCRVGKCKGTTASGPTLQVV